MLETPILLLRSSGSLGLSRSDDACMAMYRPAAGPAAVAARMRSWKLRLGPQARTLLGRQQRCRMARLGTARSSTRVAKAGYPRARSSGGGRTLVQLWVGLISTRRLPRPTSSFCGSPVRRALVLEKFEAACENLAGVQTQRHSTGRALTRLALVPPVRQRCAASLTGAYAHSHVCRCGDDSDDCQSQGLVVSKHGLADGHSMCQCAGRPRAARRAVHDHGKAAAPAPTVMSLVLDRCRRRVRAKHCPIASRVMSGLGDTAFRAARHCRSVPNRDARTTVFGAWTSPPCAAGRPAWTPRNAAQLDLADEWI